MSENNSIFEQIRCGDIKSLFSKLNKDNINIKNEYGQSLLQEAIASERYGIAEKLVELNVDINNVDHKGQTAIHYLSERNRVDLLKVLLDKGGDLSISDKFGNQPLWTAVFNARGCYDVVRELVKNNADPHNKNNAGRTPLDFATQIGDCYLIDLLNSR